MRTNVSIRHLRSFVAVAKTGSFTRAAERLFLTQSTLTATIQQLEEDVGLTLFDRNTRNVALTDTAVGFLEKAERLLQEFDAMIGDLRSISESAEGHLRIAAAPSVLTWLVVPAADRFGASFPNVTLSLREGGSADIERRVVNGEVDFGLSSPQNAYRELEYAPLLKDQYGVVCSADHPLAQSVEPLDWVDIAPYEKTMVGLASDTHIGILHRETLQRFGLASYKEEVSSSSSLFSVLSMGRRFSIVPALTAKTHQLSELVFRPLTNPVIERDICFITRKLRSLSPSAGRLQEAVLAILGELKAPPGVAVIGAQGAEMTRVKKRSTKA